MALTVDDVRHEIVVLPSHFRISQIPRWHRTTNRCGSNVIRRGFVYAERKYELLLLRDPLHISIILPSSDSAVDIWRT